MDTSFWHAVITTAHSSAHWNADFFEEYAEAMMTPHIKLTGCQKTGLLSVKSHPDADRDLWTG